MEYDYIECGDCLHLLKQLPDKSIDLVVTDPFLGSGTTAIACVNTNRHYIGFELDKDYYDIACKRLDEVELV